MNTAAYETFAAANPFCRDIVTTFLLASLPAEKVFKTQPQDYLRQNAHMAREGLFEAVTGERLSARRLRPAKQQRAQNVLEEMRMRAPFRGWDGGMPPFAV